MMDWFIDEATFEDKTITLKGLKDPIRLKRGQLVFTQQQLCDEFGATRDQIRGHLRFMEKLDFSTNKTTNRFTVSTILNYNKYQLGTNDQPPTKPPTDPQQSPNRAFHPYKRNIKKEEERATPFEKFKTWRKNICQEMDKDFEAEMQAKLKQLVKQGQDPMAVVDQSIKKGWLKLYPVNDNQNEDDGSESAKKRIEATAKHIAAVKDIKEPALTVSLSDKLKAKLRDKAKGQDINF